jgi:FtsH Extracellular
LATTIVLKRWHWFLFDFLWLVQLFGWWEMLKHMPDGASVLHLLHSFGRVGYVWAVSRTGGSAFITTVIWAKLLEVLDAAPEHRSRSLDPTAKTVVQWLVIVFSAFLLWQVVKNGGEQRSPETSYSEFLSQVEAGNVRKVKISKTPIICTYRDGRSFRVVAPVSQEGMLQSLRHNNVEIWYQGIRLTHLGQRGC